MNILLLSNHLNIGGISSYLFSLGNGLAKSGNKVFVASSAGEMVPKIKAGGAEFIPIPIRVKFELHPTILISQMKLSGFILKNKINIIHANTRVTQVLADLLSRSCGIPYMSTCHGFFRNNFGRRLFPLWGDRVIAISDSVKQHLLDDFKVQEDKIRLIYNGIDVNKFNSRDIIDKANIKAVLGLKPGRVVGIVARLSDVKGHTYLIEAMRNVIKEFPDTQLLIVGDGREKDNLLRKVMESKITENVKFIASVDDTTQILPIMDLFVMPSLQEGLGLAVMEAQAAGLPVVASNIGGLSNLIQDGITGLLVPPKDIYTLSAAITELLRNMNKAEMFGANGRKFIEQNFSLDIMIEKTEEVYKECVEGYHEGR